jgi:branched-chain amino acid transport system substrate-binding protein
MGGSMRIRALVAILGLLALAAVACDNEEGGGGSGGGGDSSGRPGVTDTEIQVGSVVGKTNPIGRPYEDAIVGAKAYFDRVNAEGGVYGRDIVIVAERDDRSLSSANISENRALVEEDGVFAIIPEVTQIFSAADYLAEVGIPTFGWLINAEWSAGPNLFGQSGSYLCFTCPSVPAATAALRTGATSAAVFAYGQSPQSTDCAEGSVNGLEKIGVPVPVKDTSLAFGFTDTSAAIAAVRDNNVDFLTTCMDVNGTATLAQDLHDAGLDVSVYAPEGYDPQVLKDLGSQIEGFYFQMVFTPFQVPDPPKGLQDYLDAMEEVGQQPNELSLTGWLNAALFVEGLNRAGEDFTQESVVEAINSMKKPFTADGILAPNVIWADTDDYPEGAHGPSLNGLACVAFVQVQNGEFVPVFGQPGKPFVCYEGNNEVDMTGVPSFDTPVYEPE